jgi:hypothetical protein
VPGFEINCELPGAVSALIRQLSGSFNGFSGIQHWAEAGNKEFGVAWPREKCPPSSSAKSAPTSGIMQYQPKRPAFFFYIMNNKVNTNGAFWQGSEDWRLGSSSK